MKLKRFDHVNVRTANLDGMVEWYDRVLGMKTGKRPDFPFPGAWVYLDDVAILHLVGQDDEPAALDPKLEHFAISAEGLSEFVAHMEANKVEYELADVPGFGITQVNIWDPDGNHIHIDFQDEKL